MEEKSLSTTTRKEDMFPTADHGKEIFSNFHFSPLQKCPGANFSSLNRCENNPNNYLNQCQNTSKNLSQLPMHMMTKNQVRSISPQNISPYHELPPTNIQLCKNPGGKATSTNYRTVAGDRAFTRRFGPPVSVTRLV